MSRLEVVRASPRPDTGGWGFRATRNRDLGRLAIVAGSYVVSARIGLSLSVAHGSATPVWAPTGISLAALLLFGRKVWPAVFVGAFLANSMTPVPIGLAFAIAVGNTAEALLGWFLLTRIGFRNGLERVHDVIALVVGAAVLSTAVSATVGVTASLFAGTIASSTYLQHWGIWWVGDMMGDLLVASLLLVWVGRWDDWRRSRALEAIVLLALLVAVSAFVFAGSRWIYSFLVFPLLLWATLRFRQRGATLAVFLTAAIALWRILEGAAPVGLSDPTAAVEAFQALFGFVVVSLLIVAATTSERAVAEETLAERERLQEQMRKALDRERDAANELRSLDEMKTTFLHAVSHDLRTPLASIFGLAVTLQRDDVQLVVDDRRDLAERIARSARKLDRLVNDLLDVERIDRGVVALNRQAIDVGALARAVVQDVELGGHPLQVDADPIVAKVDAVQIERIVENLVTNAVRHTPEGTSVWLGVRAQGGGVLISVEDAGPGVPPRERSSIFRPFERADPRESAPGLGIGLSLVSAFAELHGGKAWVEERIGGGAAFKVLIPEPT
ncbi:MAG TPA: MASE1 domain-containing protein [Actinomycetota bacterium]